MFSLRSQARSPGPAAPARSLFSGSCAGAGAGDSSPGCLGRPWWLEFLGMPGWRPSGKAAVGLLGAQPGSLTVGSWPKSPRPEPRSPPQPLQRFGLSAGRGCVGNEDGVQEWVQLCRDPTIHPFIHSFTDECKLPGCLWALVGDHRARLCTRGPAILAWGASGTNV